MLGDARIHMADGRELTVPQYHQYLREKGRFVNPRPQLKVETIDTDKPNFEEDDAEVAPERPSQDELDREDLDHLEELNLE